MGEVISRLRQVRLDYQQRLGREVTISEVAKATNVSRATLSNLEHGKTSQVSFQTLAALCAFYGCTVGDLLEYAEEQSRGNSQPTLLKAA